MNRSEIKTTFSAVLVCTCCLAAMARADGDTSAQTVARTRHLAEHPIRKPLGPDELPDALPGRWKVSLCVSIDPGHAWIRFENVETHEVRTVSRFHLLVGGWFDARQFRWNYGPTTRTGVYMDREQSCEEKVRDGKRIMLSAYVDNPRILKGENDGRGHGMMKNNCVTYTRDAWHFYTGEYYPLPEGVHTPDALRNCILHYHPEVLPVPAAK